MFAMWKLALVTCSLLAIAAGRASGQEFVQKITNPDPLMVSDSFGGGVAMDDGLAIVSAQTDDVLGRNTGAVHIYRNINGVWVNEATLRHPGPILGINPVFGTSVSIARTPHGEVAVVGAVFDHVDAGDGTLLRSGSAFVFRHDGFEWVLEQRLTASTLVDVGWFGVSVGVSGDFIAVGAMVGGRTRLEPRGLYIYQYFPGNAPGEQWVETLTAGTPPDVVPTDLNAAESLAINATTLEPFVAVGWPGKGDQGSFSGAAYIYRLVVGEWIVEQRLDDLLVDGESHPILSQSDTFGTSVSVSGDVVVVGASRFDAGGAAFIFRHTGDGNWIWQDTLTHPGPAPAFHFGMGVAVSDDMLLVRDWWGQVQDPPGGGVFLYRHVGSAWSFVEQIVNPDARPRDTFGSPAIHRGTALIGAPDDWTEPTRGAVYAYRLFNSPAGTNIATQPVDAATGESPATITFTEITSPGTTTIEITTEAPPLPSGLKLSEPEVFYDIQTTATFDGKITICISYDDANVPDEEALELRHHDGTDWVDITTTRDPVNNIICGETDSLSPFAIFQPLPVQDPILLLMDLIAYVASVNMHHGIQNSLDAKLDAALSALESAAQNDKPAAANALQAFINHAQAQSGNHIPTQVAAELISRAQAIIALLNQ